MSAPDTAPAYPLRIGVTGHRRLADEAGVAHALAQLLETLAAAFDAGPRLPATLTLVSPLARGADSLAARAILARPGARLEAMLPLPVEAYREDFTTPAESAAFDLLLAGAARVEAAPAGALAPAGSARDHAYLRAGQRVVDDCELLVAVWDGLPAARVGGTADVVRYALAQERPVLWIHAGEPGRPAVLLTGADFGAARAGEPVRTRTRALPAKAAALSPGWRQHAGFWTDDEVDPAVIAAARGAEARRLEAAAAASGLQPGLLVPVLAGVLPHFARADRLALHYQRRHARALQGVLYLGALAVTLAVAQAVFLPEQLWPTALEVLVMTALLALWLWGRRQHWHAKWLNDRCLAERLRGVLFTALLGPAAPEPAPALPFYRGPSQWIAAVAAQIAAGVAGTVVPAPEPAALRRFLLVAWLDHQRAFNEATAARKAATAHLRHRLEFALIAGSFLMACLHLAGVGHGAPGAPALQRVDAWITFLALVLLPWAGAVHAVTAQLELERMAERARRMALGLDRLASRMAGAATTAEIAEVAREARALTSQETHEWWVLLSFQEARLHA